MPPNRVERGFCEVRLRDPPLLFIQGREGSISPALYGVQSTIVEWRLFPIVLRNTPYPFGVLVRWAGVIRGMQSPVRYR